MTQPTVENTPRTNTEHIKRQTMATYIFANYPLLAMLEAIWRERGPIPNNREIILEISHRIAGNNPWMLQTDTYAVRIQPIVCNENSYRLAIVDKDECVPLPVPDRTPFWPTRQ